MDIYLDIETIARPESEIRASLPPFDPSKVSVPGNYKKQETIDAYIADAKASYGNDIIARAALSPRHGRIAIIGTLNDTLLQSEEHGLNTVWLILSDAITRRNARIIGFNIKGFDLPFMVRRSLALGIAVPPSIWRPRERYAWGENVVDLLDVWKGLVGYRSEESCSLASVLSELGLPQKTGSGADFGKLWETDKVAALAYNAQDLECERALAERLGV